MVKSNLWKNLRKSRYVNENKQINNEILSKHYTEVGKAHQH